MERAVPRRDGGSVFKSTGATVLAKTPALVAKPESELKGPSKGPANSPDVAGRAHGASSSSRPGLRADGLVESHPSLPGVPSVLNDPLVEQISRHLEDSEGSRDESRGQQPKRRSSEPVSDDDDLEALLKGLDDEPSPAAPAATATPAVDSPPAGRQARGGPGLTREDSHKVAVAKEASESCTSCGKCFEAGQNIYESSLSGKRETLCSTCWAKVAPHCVVCGEVISGTMAKVGEDAYHQNCLKCTQCHKPIEGRLSKMECGLACGACADEIDREIQELQSLLAQHDETGAALLIGALKVRGINPPEMKPQDLGQCSACQRSFKAGQQIYESPEDKRTLCEACYLSAAPKCAACLMPVVGTVARVGESAYHPECLVCSGCRQKITGAFVKSDAGFLCSECRQSAT